MEILMQLNDELGRLYIAGSKNAVGDPRIKKYIPTFEKLGEKSKVFVTLKSGLEALVSGKEEDSYSNLAKVYTLVNSILVTQKDITCKDDNLKDIDENEKVYKNVLTYKELNSFINDYGSNDSESLKQKIIEAINNDPRCYNSIDNFLGATYKNEKMYKTLFQLDTTLALYLVNTFEIKNTLACGEKLKYINVMLKDNIDFYNNKIVPLAKKIIEEKCSKVIPIALEILGNDIENENIVLEFGKKKKQEYVESSLVALHIMGSKEFIKIFEETGKNNLNTCVDSIFRLIEIYNGEEKLTAEIDYIYNQYMKVLLDNEKEPEYRAPIINKIGNLLSRLNYDKYHSFFEKVFKISWIYSDDFYSNSYDLIMFNLISNDIRYNTLIFESISNFLELNNKNKNPKNREKLYHGKNKIFYYYLIVVRNLFDEKKAAKLSIELLSFCRDLNILTANFKNNKYFNLISILSFLDKNIEVEKISREELQSKYSQYKNNSNLEDINKEVFDFLFEDTFYFQSILGEDYYSFRLLGDFLLNNPKLQDDFLNKIMIFIEKHIGISKSMSIHVGLERFYFHNLMNIDNEKFARTYFDILLYITENVADVKKYKYRSQSLLVTVQNLKNYEKYKYLLEEKKYIKLAFLLTEEI